MQSFDKENNDQTNSSAKNSVWGKEMYTHTKKSYMVWKILDLSIHINWGLEYQGL